MEKVEIENNHVLKCIKCGIEIPEGIHCEKCLKGKGYTIKMNKGQTKIMEKYGFTLKDLIFYGFSAYGKDKITHKDKEQIEIDAWIVLKDVLKLVEKTE